MDELGKAVGNEPASINVLLGSLEHDRENVVVRALKVRKRVSIAAKFKSQKVVTRNLIR